jgi:nucleoside-diphosphate-sugar epimerase
VALILATGLGGFLGCHVAAVLRENHFEAEALPRDLRRSSANLEAHLRARKPAAIIHMAGIVDVQYCRRFPLEAFQAHVSDTACLLEAIRCACPETPLIYIATDKSFGEQESCGLAAHYQPGFPYETSKAAEDLLVESYAISYGLPIYLLRFPNLFGEGDVHRERLIPSICLAAAEKRELVVRTRLDGTIRQYLYVGDAAEIVVQTLRARESGRDVWPRNHFGPPHLKTVGDVVRDVEAIVGESLKVVVLNQPGEVSRLSLKDENCFNYRYTGWREALERTVRWYHEPVWCPPVPSLCP